MLCHRLILHPRFSQKPQLGSSHHIVSRRGFERNHSSHDFFVVFRILHFGLSFNEGNDFLIIRYTLRLIWVVYVVVSPPPPDLDCPWRIRISGFDDADACFLDPRMCQCVSVIGIVSVAILLG